MTPPLELLSADILYTGMGLPRSPGAVVVGGDRASGRTVAATGHPDDLRRLYPQARERRAGPVISPPPVNAHTHLDMSAYPFRALPYFRWIPEHVMANRHLRGLEGAQRGLERIRASGAAGLGDIVWMPGVMEFLLAESEVPGVAYLEVLDPNPDTAQETFERTLARVEQYRRLERPGGMRLGLSPHASYTVSHRLFRLLADYARREALPLQIHVAEHPSEREFFASGTGELAASFLPSVAGRGVSSIEQILGRAPDPALTPVSYLAELGVLDARPTLIHMVAITEDDARTVGQAGCAVVSCPRSNLNLECGVMPWTLLAKHGVEIALGTDSVASGETLDIHDELQAALRAHPALDARQIVRAAVKGGRRVLGLRVPTIRRGEAWNEAYVWPEAAGESASSKRAEV